MSSESTLPTGPNPRGASSVHARSAVEPTPAQVEETSASAIEKTRRYRPLCCIGRGGMGEVWRVEDTDLGRTVALKIIRPDCAPSLSVLEPRFREEAQVTAQLQHPAIVPVYDMGRLPGGALFYTMREVAGVPFHSVIDEVHRASSDGGGGWQPTQSGWTWLRLVEVVRLVAEAVGLAHARGVLHRDLKPSNILVTQRGDVFVLDWGLAKVLDRSVADLPAGAPPIRSRRADSDAPQTAMGQVAGTVGYMAPEQAAGRIDLLSPASDVYALGAVLVRALTGEEPARDPGRIGRSLDLLQENGRLPAALHSVLRRAVALNPSDRFEDGRAFADGLLSCLDGYRQREQARSLAHQAEEAIAGRDASIRSRVDAVLARLLDAEGGPVVRSVESVVATPGALQALQALQAAQVIRTNGDGDVFLADVALVATWPRLRSLAEDSQGRRNLARLAEAAREWNAQGRTDDHVARGAELATLSTWAASHSRLLAPLEVEWLDAGRELARRAARGRRVRLQLGGSIAIAAAVAMGALWIRAEAALRETEIAKAVAESAEQIARGRRLLAEGRARQSDAHDSEALALYRAAATLLPGDPEPQALVRELASTGRSVHQLPVSHGKLQAIDVSPDGRFVATVSRDGTVSIHALADGRLVVERNVGAWAQTRWVGDGRLSIATESMEGFLLDPATGSLEGPFGDGNAVPLIDIRPSDGRVVVSEPTGLRFSGTGAVPHPVGDQSSIGWFSADSRFLVTLSMRQGAQLYSGDDLRPLWHLGGPPHPKSLRFVGNDAVLIFTGARSDASVWFYDLTQRTGGVEVSALTGAPSMAAKMDSRPDGGAFAYGSGSEVVAVVRGPDGLTLRWSTPISGGEVLRVAFSPDGEQVAAASSDGQLTLLDARTGARLTTWQANTAGIAGLDWTPDGASLVSAGLDGRLQVWRPGVDLLEGVLTCGGRPISGEMRVVRDGPAWVVLSAGQLCIAPNDGSLDADVWEGLWTDVSPGLEPGTLGGVSNGRPFVINANGVATPLPFAYAGGAKALTPDRAHGRWFLQSTVEVGAPLRADGTRDPFWQLFLGDITVLPQLNRLLVTPEEMGPQSTSLRVLSTGQEIASLDIGSPVDPTEELVLDQQHALALLLSPSGEIHAFDLHTGETRQGPTPPLEGSFALAGGGDSGWLVAASQKAYVRAWQLVSPERPRWTVRLDAEPLQVGVDAGAQHVVVRSADRTQVLELDSGALLSSLPAARSLQFLGDGRVVLSSAGPVRRQVVWRLADPRDDPVADLGERTNLRVCRGSHAVVPVVPYPEEASVWAPEGYCPEPAGGL